MTHRPRHSQNPRGRSRRGRSRLPAVMVAALCLLALFGVQAAIAASGPGAPAAATAPTTTVKVKVKDKGPATHPATTAKDKNEDKGKGKDTAKAKGTDPACTRRGVLFCENFNALAVGAAVSPNWTVDTQQGTLTVEPLRHGSRDRVLRAHTVGNGRALLTIPDFRAPGNSYYGRMWVRVDAFPTAPDFAHFILVQATGTGSKEMVRPVGGQFINTQFLQNGGPGRSLWGIGADGGATGDWTNWKETATAVPGRWQCLEWTMQAPTNRVQMWVNGKTNPDLVVTTDNHGGNKVPFVLPKVNKLQIGWWLFQPGPTPLQFDLRYDNIVLSSTRVGCGTAPATYHHR